MRTGRLQTVLAAVLAGALTLAVPPPVSAQLQRIELKAIGTWSNLMPYLEFERPFYRTWLAEASNGRITADLTSIVELGLKGWEVMRLLRLGLFDVAHGVYTYVSSEDVAIEGIDLAAASRGWQHGREIVQAYEPIIRKRFDETFNARYLMTFRWGNQYIFCSKPLTALADIRGKRVRVYSTTLADLVEGLGGISVTIAFPEVVTALEKDIAECAITGSMPAYQARWHEVVTHVLAMPVGTGVGFAAMSNRTWDRLDAATQAFLAAQYDALSDRIWERAARDDEISLDCLSGRAPCPIGDPGDVVLTEPSEADVKLRETLLRTHVLSRYAERCGDACIRDWNATVGEVVGVTAPQ